MKYNKRVFLFIVNFLIISSFCNTLWAQKKGSLNYKITIKTPFGLNELNNVIFFDNNKSIEFLIKRYKKAAVDTISESEFKKVLITSNKKEPFLYKDLSTKELILSDNISFKYFLINDTLNNFKWKITSEHKNIFNHICTKALLNFRGRDYIAWFAEDISLPYGPWKFGGLPGLILKVSDNNNDFDYEITGIDFHASFDKNIIQIPDAYSNDKEITHKEFMELVFKKNDDYKRMSKIVTTEDNGATVSGSIKMAEKMEKF